MQSASVVLSRILELLLDFVFVKYGISNSVFTGLRIYMSD